MALPLVIRFAIIALILLAGTVTLMTAWRMSARPADPAVVTITPNQPQPTPRVYTNAPPDTQLQAKVLFTGTQFAVVNLSTERTWTDVECTINPSGIFRTGGYSYRFAELKPGIRKTIPTMEFATSDGARFNPFQTKPMSVTITARVNGTVASFSGTFE